MVRYGAGRIAGVLAVVILLIQSPVLAHPSTTAKGKDVEEGATVAPALDGPVEAVANFHAALAKGDTAAALSLLAEDVLIFESGGTENSRAEYASHHLKSDAAFSAAVPRMLISRTHGEQGDTAWVMSVENVEGTYRDRQIKSRSVETMLLRRVNGSWQIFHIHWSSADQR